MNFFALRLTVSLFIAGTALLGSVAQASDAVALVRYGTRFGQCLGYCTRSIDVFPDRVVFSAIAYHPTKKLPAISNETTLDKQQEEELRRLLSETSVDGLATRIGCPDCADGGAEWIEIRKSSGPIRVLYEKGNPPIQLRALASWLGAMQGKFRIPPAP